MNKRKTGTEYEQKAAQYLKTSGFQILTSNYRCPLGEIDLIAYDGKYLVFIEVKYRRTEKDGFAADAVNYKKQKRIRRAAEWYLMEKKQGDDIPCRFDVIAIDSQNITHIKNAFD